MNDGSDETPNIAYFTQAIWKFEEPEPEFLIKLFIVAWLGIEKLEVKLEHAVMVIIDAANAMGRMTPGCNISFYMMVFSKKCDIQGKTIGMRKNHRDHPYGKKLSNLRRGGQGRTVKNISGGGGANA